MEFKNLPVSEKGVIIFNELDWASYMYTTESNSTQMPIGWPIDIPKQGYLGLLQPWFQQISELYPPHPSWRCLYLIRKKNSSLIWRNCASCALWFENYLAFIWGEFNQSYALIAWNKQLVVVHRKVDNRISVIHMVNDALHIYHTNPKAIILQLCTMYSLRTWIS